MLAVLLGLTVAACGGGGGERNFAQCGNGLLDSGERCDDGNRNDGDACTAVCQPARCGDGAIEAGIEQCDGLNLGRTTCESLGYAAGPGNRTLPGCSASCLFDLSLCGAALPTPTATAPPTATPTMTPTPTVPVSNCGDGLLELGESCTSCPADCQPAPCTPGGVTVTFNVGLTSSGAPSQVQVALAYRSSVVSLPGTGSDVSVRRRVRFAPPPPNPFVVNDLDYAVTIASTVASGLPTAPAPFATAQFDVCSGASDPTVEDLSCVVQSCTGSSGPLGDCRCEVSLP